MRVIAFIVSVVFLAVGSAGSSPAANEPLVSVARASTLVKESLYLAGDLVVYTSEKLEESLGDGNIKQAYADFVQHLKRYRQMIIEWTRTSPIASAVYNAMAFAVSQTIQQYERIDKLSGKILDPVVRDFENRFPTCKGYVGKSLIDRLFLAAWFMWLLKVSLCAVKMVLIGRTRRAKI